MVRTNLKRYEMTHYGTYYGIGTVKELSERSGVPEQHLREKIYRYQQNPDIGLYTIPEIYPEEVIAPAKDTLELVRSLIGDNVKRLREEQHVERKYLADAVGVHDYHIERLERGSSCSMKLLAKLIDFFQVEPMEMLENWKDRIVIKEGEI